MVESQAQGVVAPRRNSNSIQSKWEECLEIIKGKISSQGYQTWVKPIIPVSYVDEKLILRVPSQFFFEWLESNYQEIIHAAVKRKFGIRAKIEYLVASTPNKQPEELSLTEEKESESPAISPQDVRPREAVEEGEYALDFRYEFSNYFVKNDNELALRAAQFVARNPGKTDYNPLFIYGNSGLGKTHLLQAIGNFVKANKKRKVVRYVTSENFLNEYIQALQSRKLNEFVEKYLKIHVLLLDDIQFLANKKKSQEGLFYLFSEMECRRRQIVISSLLPPAQLRGFDSRLTSFFHRGLIVDLIPPSLETRLAWIDDYVRKNELNLLPEVREFIARNLTDSLHHVRSIMVRIAAQTSLLGTPVSLSKTRKLLRHLNLNGNEGLGKFPGSKMIKIERIIEVVSQHLHIPVDLIVGHSRNREVSLARQIAIYLIKELTGETFQTIGYHFGDRHYTAILHSYKKIKGLVHKNPMLNSTVVEIKNLLLD